MWIGGEFMSSPAAELYQQYEDRWIKKHGNLSYLEDLCKIVCFLHQSYNMMYNDLKEEMFRLGYGDQGLDILNALCALEEEIRSDIENPCFKTPNGVHEA